MQLPPLIAFTAEVDLKDVPRLAARRKKVLPSRESERVRIRLSVPPEANCSLELLATNSIFWRILMDDRSTWMNYFILVLA